ncbi:HAMP domain-containing protein [Rhizobium rhizophilum]|uniref:histidine kinase n=1 Tax=Rhizobium rhizophilum TaxID=1850373 RepID=A0ABY2QRQ4_9HYPH|nr:HAMP domain-containing protein [Rhizobium rhizophilum]
MKLLTAAALREKDVRKRLFAVAVTALLPGIGLLTYNELASREERRVEVHNQASQTARDAAAELDRVLEGAKSLLIAVSALPTVVDLDPVNCGTSLKRISSNLQMTGAILVIDAERKLVCDSQGNPAGVDFSERTYVNDGLTADADTLVVGNYTVSKLTGAAVLPVAVPLIRDEAIIGVVATAIRLDWLQERMAERDPTGRATVILADREGVILAHAPHSGGLVGTKLPEALSSKVQAAGFGTLETTGLDNNAQTIIAYRPATPVLPVFVSTGLSSAEAFSSINRTTWASLSMVLLSVVAAFLAATFVGDRFILRPIYRIVGVLESYKAGSLASRTHMESTGSELGLVGSTVDSLLDELEARRAASALSEERRSLLVGELRHRVKNTLAVVTAIARQTFPRDERLSSFSQRLSALGRAYDLIFAGQEGKSEAQIADIVRAALAPYEDDTEPPFQITGPALAVQPEGGLALSLIIHELATNATKYGALSEKGGRVLISWSSANGRVSFSWQELHGPPVAKPERVGFGSQLIGRAFPASYKPKLDLDFAPDGLKCTIEFEEEIVLGMPPHSS